MRTLMIISLALLSLVAQATVYKWVDKDGKVHYSDEPTPKPRQWNSPTRPRIK